MDINLDLTDLENSIEIKKLEEIELKRIEYQKIEYWKHAIHRYLEQLELVPTAS